MRDDEQAVQHPEGDEKDDRRGVAGDPAPAEADQSVADVKGIAHEGIRPPCGQLVGFNFFASVPLDAADAPAAQELTGEEAVPAEEPVVDENLAGYSLEELNVATINPLNGNFMDDVWGKMTSDIDVWYLLHGYDLVHWNTVEGMFAPDDTVVSGIVVTTDGSGDDMFTISLYPDLYYSDGTKITAWDYAFTTLLPCDQR